MVEAHPITPDKSSGGRFRRIISLARRNEETLVGWLEDEVHHFGVTLKHDGREITDAASVAVRFPYTTCGGANLPFRKLIGTPLGERATDIGKVVDMRLQCTHLYDLAALLIAFATTGRDQQRYEALVEDRPFVGLNSRGRRVMGRGRAQLLSDGLECLQWDIEGQTILGPGEWAGWPLMEGFRARSECLDVSLAEQAFVLRRAIMVANGRTATRYPLPRERGWPAVCHTFQPHVRDYAERIEGMRRNYEDSDEHMLAHVSRTPAESN